MSTPDPIGDIQRLAAIIAEQQYQPDAVDARALILCGPDESGDLDARCRCGHTKREHLRPSSPCWYFRPAPEATP